MAKQKKQNKSQHRKVPQCNVNARCTEKRSAILTTLFILGGLYASFICYLFIQDGNMIEELYKALGSFGCIYANIFAILGVAYSKFAQTDFVQKSVYWLSLLSFVIIISIFAQAQTMLNSSIHLWLPLLRTRYTTIALQIALIYALAIQKELVLEIKYHKKKI